jgi:hypothetical protein
MLSHDNLGNYYKVTFAMVQHHKYSLTEIENMIPFERQIYVDMLSEYLEKMEEKNNANKTM